MLLILMYHRVHGVGQGSTALRRHLAWLRDHHPLVLPGEPLPAGELSVCLTFDDATADFCHQVYPLLEELDIRALVAVPTGLIEADTEVSLERRLAAQSRAGAEGGYALSDTPLCTWAELRHVQAEGRVQCASHGHRHLGMTDPGTDPEAELTRSRAALEAHLGRTPETFVYPFGKASREVQCRVRRHYPYAMRIGSALNRDWRGSGGLLYRVDAERFWPQGRVWSRSDLLAWHLKRLGNRLRGI
jgi:peptidoglycan/xylan/chitin deacetylase (PgdA/CDA1 family)